MIEKASAARSSGMSVLQFDQWLAGASDLSSSRGPRQLCKAASGTMNRSMKDIQPRARRSGRQKFAKLLACCANTLSLFFRSRRLLNIVQGPQSHERANPRKAMSP